MEPVEAAVRYHITTKVLKTFQEKRGWFVHFEGSWESLYLGDQEPDFKQNDVVHITIERIPNAQSS